MPQNKLTITNSQPLPDQQNAGGLTIVDSQPAPQSAQQGGIDSLPSSQSISDTAENLGAGFVKGLGQTIGGVSTLLNKIPYIGETLAPSAGVKALDQMSQTHGTSQSVGSGLESLGEFAAGDEAIGGLAKLARVARVAPEVLELAEKYPTATKILTASARGAAIGGTQGGIKGASQGQAGQQAIGGAIGGGIGAGAAEAVGSAMTPLARIFGLGGLTSKEAFTKAARPTVFDKRFVQSLQTATPLLKEIPPSSVKTVGDFEDAIHSMANNLWTDRVEPQVARHANDVIDGASIAQRIRQGISEGMQELFPEEAAPVEAMAQKFADSKLSLSKADEYLRTLNAQLKQYYRLSPDARYARGLTNGRLGAMEDAADGLRDAIYGTLENSGEPMPRQLRQQYGALRDVERVFAKRATVADRQAPINLPQAIGMMEAGTALLSGHPVTAAAGAIPFVTKARQAPESLIRQGLKAAEREAAGPSVASGIAKTSAKQTTAALGVAAGRSAASNDEGDDSH